MVKCENLVHMQLQVLASYSASKYSQNLQISDEMDFPERYVCSNIVFACGITTIMNHNSGL